jgi:hypothetical protein
MYELLLYLIVFLVLQTNTNTVINIGQESNTS